ncbi:hypothetical protein CDV31_002423 [Fusarium ambrosium]|uniref:Nucleoside phosphorylase domain-containing protein n=1 Tax=Fusarium ambrosium TaxID=131363 RepID=A0A428UWL7_9HYPO|nr:hypothetical protein CDV31_002423 [Fusarium ambrosium]
MATPPASRNDFEIAIVCALPLEYDAVCNLVDQFWDDDYGRAAGDPNMYTNGRVGAFNIVIVLLSGMGKVKATSATASLRSSYPNLELALVTGICGGVPITGSGKELVLGDVVISNTIVQYDLGRRYPNEFETKHTLSDSLGRPALHIQNLVVTFKTSRGLQQLEGRAASHLKTLQSRQLDEDETAKECDDGPGAVCNASRKLSCRELGCDVQQRVSRKRLQDSQRLRVPQVLVGRLGSGDTVLKSGEDRDRIAEEHDLIAFEMEGAGAWDEIPCIIVKGICDYADSHKNKNWQNFAAATAASVAKALVEKYPRTDKPSTSSYTPDRTMKTVSNTNPRTLSSHACRVLAYDRNENFIPRPDINSKLDQLLPFNSDEFHSAALWGLGGSGKTQIALQYAYNRCRDPDCSVFWVHADTKATLTQDYKTIAGVLGLGVRLEGSELLGAVRRGIESQKRWVIVVDNADDLALFGVGQASGNQQRALLDSIPKGPNGTVLWTSRDQRVDGTLVGPQRGIQVTKMTVKESRELLEKWRREVTPDEEVQEVESLLEELQWLPLAISQAGAYLYRTDTSVSEYLSQLKRETGRWRVLGEDEFDRHRRGDAQNSVLRTWAISIRRLKQDCQTAYTILHVLAFVDNQNIPVELLAAAAKHKYRQEAQTTKPRQREQTLKRAVRRLKDFSFRSASPRPEEQVKKDDADDLDELGRAVRRLKNFSFMTEHRGEGNKRTFEMHKLVQDAARYGLKTQQQQSTDQVEGYFAKAALDVVDSVCPQEKWYSNQTRGDCERYLAHTLRIRVCNFLYWRGRFEEQRLALEANARQAQKAFGERDLRSITALKDLGWAFLHLGQLQEVEECANKALTLLQEALGGDKHGITLECKRLLAEVHIQQRRPEEAKQLLMEALDEARQFLDEDHESILDCINELARAHMSLKEYDEADKLIPRLLKQRQDKYGQNAPNTLGVHNLLGNLYYEQGRHDEVVQVLSPLLDFKRQLLGDENLSTLVTMNNLALSQRYVRKEEAVELMQEYSRLCHKAFGADHPRTKAADEQLEEWELEDTRPNL